MFYLDALFCQKRKLDVILKIVSGTASFVQHDLTCVRLRLDWKVCIVKQEAQQNWVCVREESVLYTANELKPAEPSRDAHRTSQTCGESAKEITVVSEYCVCVCVCACCFCCICERNKSSRSAWMWCVTLPLGEKPICI